MTEVSGLALRGIGWPRALVAGDWVPVIFALTSPIIPGGMICLRVEAGKAAHGVEGMPKKSLEKKRG